MRTRTRTQANKDTLFLRLWATGRVCHLTSPAQNPSNAAAGSLLAFSGQSVPVVPVDEEIRLLKTESDNGKHAQPG